MFDQVKSFLIYFVEANRIASSSEYDIIVASSSRLFTVFLDPNLAKKRNKKFNLYIRDLFRETITEVIENKMVSIIGNV